MSEQALIQVNVVSLKEEIYSGLALHLQLRGRHGALCIYPRHTQLLTTIEPGPAVVHTPQGDDHVIFLSGGFLEVQPQVVTILAETAIRATDLDEAAAKKAQEQAQHVLEGQQSDVDYAMARSELVRAAGLLQTLKEFRRRHHR